ncbi:MAG: hypothetical protein QOF51_3825, partial [Chloroflexota bacterium]|nr:hypothetical protein [Chloroflexota bacterium]
PAAPHRPYRQTDVERPAVGRIMWDELKQSACKARFRRCSMAEFIVRVV